MIETPPEVFEVADRLEARLGKPAPHDLHADWGSVASRFDEAMRTRLLEIAKRVV